MATRPDPRLHRDHERGRRAARPRQPLSAAAAGQISEDLLPSSRPKRCSSRAIPTIPTTATGASVVAASPARRRGQRRGRACGDAPLRRARLSQEPSRPAPAARGLFRRHRHAGDQAAAQDAGRGVSQEASASEFRIDPELQPRKQERPAMTDVLISAEDLVDLFNKEPCVVIDTRNPDAYAAGHMPGAVNVHDIFTYLATSTPEGMAELQDEIRRRLRRRRPVGQGNRGHLRAVDEFRLRPVLPRLLPADHARLSEDQGAAWRLRRLGRGGPADHDRCSDAGAGHRSRSCRRPATS